MSRVSRKSELSPSVTRGSNAIDLGKNSDIDMDRKSQPSVTSGGIGVSTEVTNIGGLSVTGGVSVDISPIDLGIQYDPAENSLGIAGGAEIPGGFLGVSGGVTVDLDTGEIVGGAIGGEVIGLGVNVSASKDGLGVEFTVQIPFTPIELSVGFGYSPEKEVEPEQEPYTTPPFSPEIEELLQPPQLPPSPYDDPANPPSYETTPQRPSAPVSSRNEICKMVVTFSSGSHYHRWNRLGERHQLEGRSYRGFAECEYTNGGRLIGGVTSWYDGYFYDSDTRSDSPPINRRNSQSPPLMPPPPPDGVWLSQAYPYDTNKIPHIRRQLAGYEVFEYWGLQFSIYEALEKLSFMKPAVPKTYNSSISSWDWWFTISPIYNIYSIEAHWCTPKKPQSNTPPFPNPPPTKHMDQCCRDILKLLRETHKRLGISKFPGQLPSTIIQEVPNEGEEPAEPSQVPIEDFVDLLNWQFERDDERWGQREIQIDIKDSDITKEGDQKKQIKFPNLAESIAEFEGQLLSIMTNVDALVALQVKNLAESGMARQEAIKGYLASKAIIKYMAFKSSEVDIPVPMTFTAGAETISELLKESEGHIKGTDYVEKETLRDVYLDLLQAAAIIRAVHWQRINTKTDTKLQLLNILKGSVDLAASIAKPQNPNGDAGSGETFNPEKDFEDFIDSVEDGFRNATGITDIQNPYGKSPDRRPRIRQIGDNIAQAGGSD